jgi:hypothetical protein
MTMDRFGGTKFEADRCTVVVNETPVWVSSRHHSAKQCRGDVSPADGTLASQDQPRGDK